MLFVYSYYNVFGTIYALFRCYTAVSRKVVQLTSMKAYAKVPKGIMHIVVCTACLIQRLFVTFGINAYVNLFWSTFLETALYIIGTTYVFGCSEIVCPLAGKACAHIHETADC